MSCKKQCEKGKIGTIHYINGGWQHWKLEIMIKTKNTTRPLILSLTINVLRPFTSPFLSLTHFYSTSFNTTRPLILSVTHFHLLSSFDLPSSHEEHSNNLLKMILTIQAFAGVNLDSLQWIWIHSIESGLYWSSIHWSESRFTKLNPDSLD